MADCQRSDFLLITDIDATLLRARQGLSVKNEQAIRQFMRRGGNFTLATGRSVESALVYARQLEVTLPTIHINGGCIYSYQTGQYYRETVLEDCFRKATAAVMEHFPQVGIVAWTKNGAMLFSHNDTTNVLRAVEKLEYQPCTLEDIAVNPYKMLFISEHGEKPQLERFLRERYPQGVDYVSTSETYFEMIPKGISKGNALRQLSELVGIELERIIAIGDYYNDIQMLSAAGLGAAVGNAPEQVKQAADLVLRDCEEDAVAQMIELLEERVFGTREGLANLKK